MGAPWRSLSFVHLPAKVYGMWERKMTKRDAENPHLRDLRARCNHTCGAHVEGARATRTAQARNAVGDHFIVVAKGRSRHYPPVVKNKVPHSIPHAVHHMTWHDLTLDHLHSRTRSTYKHATHTNTPRTMQVGRFPIFATHTNTMSAIAHEQSLPDSLCKQRHRATPPRIGLVRALATETKASGRKKT